MTKRRAVAGASTAEPSLPGGQGGGAGGAGNARRISVGRLWRALWVPCRIVASVFFDFRAYGVANVPPTGGCLLVCNHQSLLDPVFVAIHLPREVSYMAKIELFAIPGFSRLIRALNAFPVRRGQADTAAIRETIQRLRAGAALTLFPEGTRTKTGDIGPIQPGIAMIVRRARVPVVPVAIDGAFGAWPAGHRLPRPHPVRIMYGRPMDLADLAPAAVVERIGQSLRAMLAELRCSGRSAEVGFTQQSMGRHG